MKITDTPPHPLVAASILSADFGNIEADCRDVLTGGADLLHVDVMDAHFVPNLTMGPDMCGALRRHFPQTYLDVHLMIERPDQFIDPFADAGASLLSFHVEVCKPWLEDGLDPRALIARIRERGMDVGMVVNPPTPVQAVEPWLDQLDLLLIMSVNPGRSGQKFIPDVLDKARWASQRLRPDQRLEMDGGLNMHTAPQAVEAGVDVLVTASALFGADDRAAVIQRMHESQRAR